MNRSAGACTFEWPFPLGLGYDVGMSETSREERRQLLAAGREYSASLASQPGEPVLRFLADWRSGTYAVEDWDGEGALPIRPEAVAQALALICSLPADLPCPDISPYPDGSVVLQWFGPARFFTLVLALFGGKRFVYSAHFGEDIGARGTEYFSPRLPQAICLLIRRALGGR